ncbi:MAG: hypothetical protein ACOCP8_05295 [archaeon]
MYEIKIKDRIGAWESDKIIETRRKSIECIVITTINEDGNKSISFKAGNKVKAEWVEHIGLLNVYRSGEKEPYIVKGIKKITDKKINGIECNDFIVNIKQKTLMCF